MKTLFDVVVQREVSGKAHELRDRSAFRECRQLLLIVHEIEGESAADLGGVGEIQFVDQRQRWEREKSPGEKTVWSIPRIWARLLSTEDGIVDVEVEHLAGSRFGANVRAHQKIALFKHPSKVDLKGIEVIVALVLELEFCGAGRLRGANAVQAEVNRVHPVVSEAI